jgi:hypothetical protein
MPEIARLSCPRAALISLPDAAEHDDQIELR